MSLRDFTAEAQRTRRENTAMLTLEEVSFAYAQELALKSTSLTIDRGDFVGLLGPNGSGKSTLLKLCSGLLRPTSGRVRYKDRDVRLWSRSSLARELAFVPQDFHLDFDFTVGELVLMGRIPHLGVLGREKREDLQIARAAMEETGVLHLADRSVMETSGGERQRAVVAMALAQAPCLLFLDEPSSHLDVRHQFEVMELLSRLNRDKGVTILMSAHDLNMAAEYCQKVILLSQGEKTVEGSPEEILTPEVIRAVYGVNAVRSQNPLSGKPHLFFGARGR